MKILLICAVGMSSSLLVKKMRELAPKDTIIDYGIRTEVQDRIGEYDVLLLGPQIRYKKDEVEAIAKAEQVPFDFIDMIHYGRVMAKEVLEQAQYLYEKKERK